MTPENGAVTEIKQNIRFSNYNTKPSLHFVACTPESLVVARVVLVVVARFVVYWYPLWNILLK
jgi:hypothetical protein